MADPQPVRALFRHLAHSTELPGNNKVLFLNAELPEHGDEREWCREQSSKLTCEQPQRNKFLEMETADFQVQPFIHCAQEIYDQAWVNLSKFRALNEQNIIRALEATKEGSIVWVCGAKSSGISSIKKWLTARHEIIGSYAKFHSQVIGVRTTAERELSLSKSTQNYFEHIGEQYQISPGLFSSDRVDNASQLLSEYLNENISGKIADLGAGWGYLSIQALRNSKSIDQLHLFENEWWGQECAKQNLRNITPYTEIQFHWKDITGEAIENDYKSAFDWIIMNPPFHEGKKTNVDLGAAFISKAAKLLKPSGKLLMVANRKLPYEDVLKRDFKRFAVLKETNQFKIIQARR